MTFDFNVMRFNFILAAVHGEDTRQHRDAFIQMSDSIVNIPGLMEKLANKFTGVLIRGVENGSLSSF
jgi:hypothetical protein